MAYTAEKIKDIVTQSVNHAWSIPEFQRGFVWKAVQVRDLVESLWLDYPIGTLLVWDSGAEKAEEKHASDAQQPHLWVVDGQQRTTALSILFGRKPYWWPSAAEWEKTLKKYDLRFDVHAKEPPYFVVANAAIRKVKGHRYLPLADLLVLDTDKDDDQRKLTTFAKEIKEQGLCDGMDVMEVYTRLDRVRKIRDKDVVTISIDHELEDVVEIFSRLNGRGTRVTEADIYLGVVAARTPGWVRTYFLPYIDDLVDAGFDVSPNLVFRTLTAVGAKKVRFKEIPDTFWNESSISPHWDRTKQAWKSVVHFFQGFGILSNNPMPSQAGLVTLVALTEKFPTEQGTLALYWFLEASRFGRYSGSGTSSLEEDLREVAEASSLREAVVRLLRQFPHTQPIEREDFLRDYGDALFLRFLLYLMVYKNEAKDWDEPGHRLGFHGVELLQNFRPQWHHIFPRKYLNDQVPEELVDALANIAVIGPTINIRISAKDPMNYIERYHISDEKLTSQFIDPAIRNTPLSQYPSWLNARAEALAQAANVYLGALREDLPPAD